MLNHPSLQPQSTSCAPMDHVLISAERRNSLPCCVYGIWTRLRHWELVGCLQRRGRKRQELEVHPYVSYSLCLLFPAPFILLFSSSAESVKSNSRACCCFSADGITSLGLGSNPRSPVSAVIASLPGRLISMMSPRRQRALFCRRSFDSAAIVALVLCRSANCGLRCASCTPAPHR
jgi:hypothetical protein